MYSRDAGRTRDRGLTLVELVVTVAMIGLVMTVITAAIIVVFRSGDGVVATVAESHDTQQVVSFLPLDVESGPSRADSYRAAVGGAPGDRGTGCLDAGNGNVLRIDVTDRRLDLVDRRIAYELVVDGAEARIDRILCEYDGTTWVLESRTNVADSLDASASPVAEAEVHVSNPSVPVSDQEVVSVELRYTQRGVAQTIEASPREEEALSSSGICGSDPLAATKNIDSFVEGDVHLSGTAVKSSLYVGGTLSFDGGPEVAQSSPNLPDLGSGSPYNNVGLFANSVDWSGSSGTLRVRNGADVVVQDNGYVGGPAGPISESGGTPSIALSPGGQVIPGTGTTLPISPGPAFFELRACSDRLAELPDSCNNGACASHVGLPADYEGTATAPGPQLEIDLTVGEANVLNIQQQNLIDLSTNGITIDVPSSVVDEYTPLIINVGSASGATITFTPPVLSGSGSTAIHVIWNFPNAAVVEIVGSSGQQLRGTVMAPYSLVTSTITIEGGVIANRFEMSGPSLNDVRSFEGFFGW